MNVSAILLAAGSGSRFGGEKLLHPLPDGTAIGAQAARNLIAAGLGVVAVVKAGDFPLADMLEQEGCYVTVFRDSALGMGASLAHGISASRSADAWLVALADMPSVSSTTISILTRELEKGAALVAPTFQGQRGHPVGFGKRFATELLALTGDVGARDLLSRNQAELALIECGDAGVLHDIDRRSDLLRAL